MFAKGDAKGDAIIRSGSRAGRHRSQACPVAKTNVTPSTLVRPRQGRLQGRSEVFARNHEYQGKLGQCRGGRLQPGRCTSKLSAAPCALSRARSCTSHDCTLLCVREEHCVNVPKRSTPRSRDTGAATSTDFVTFRKEFPAVDPRRHPVVMPRTCRPRAPSLLPCLSPQDIFVGNYDTTVQNELWLNTRTGTKSGPSAAAMTIAILYNFLKNIE